jgi:hypothetical protein
MLVRIEKDWENPDLRRQTPGGTGRWGDIEITFDRVRECDLLIVLNSPNRDIRVRCPVGNRWLFSQESPVDMYRWHRDSFHHFDRVFTFWNDVTDSLVVHDQTALPWHVGRSYDELRALTIDQAKAHKRDAVSWVTSAATHKPGHKLRMAFKDHLLAQGFAFDLFGRGFDPIADKFDGLFPYKYSIAIENHGCNDYWTEKIADCFLSWTMPIYWGAPNILDYFPAESMVLIDPADPAAALATVRAAMQADRWQVHLDALAEARRRVLERYQFFPHLQRLVGQYAAPSPQRVVSSFIPANPAHFGVQTPVQRVKRGLRRFLRL